jgi:predicted Zn-dependent protease with MMP-like domain
MVTPATPAGTGQDASLTAGRSVPGAVQTRPRRDRRGRGLRGPLAPAQVPLSRSRAQQFDELVDAAVARLERRWGQELAAVEFAVAEVPPSELPDWAGTPVPLAWLFPAVAAPAPTPGSRTGVSSGGSGEVSGGALPPRIVLYRRPLEARAGDRRELEALVLDVLVEQVADLLGLEPEAVDPDYGFFED